MPHLNTVQRSVKYIIAPASDEVKRAVENKIASYAFDMRDHCEKNPASPGRLSVTTAEDHTEEFGSYILEAVENQGECVAQVYTCCGREKANADKLAKAWNAHEELIATLRSIAANTCCANCQEAALVARAALAKIEGR